MKNTKRVLLILLCMVLSVSLLAGCKKKEPEPETFDYSRDLTDEGFWKDVNASEIVKVPEDYNSFTVKRSEVTPTEEELQHEIDEVLASYQYTVDVTERAAQLKDVVDINFEGRLADGTTVDGMSGNSPQLELGSGSMIPGFEDAIVEANAFTGDEFDIHVTFPDPYQNNTDLSGKDAVFTIKINKISEKIIPELTDEFVTDKYAETEGLMTVAEFRHALTDALVEENLLKKLTDHIVNDAIYGQLPEKLITFQQDANYDYYMLQAKAYANYYTNYGYTAEQWFYNLTYCENKEQFDEMNEDIYIQAVKESLAMQAIAEQEGITVSEDDLKEYFTANEGVEDYSEYKDYYGIGYLKMVVRNEKLVADLYKNAKIED